MRAKQKIHILQIENEYGTPIEPNSTIKLLINLKIQIIHKTKQTKPNKNLKEVQVRTIYTKKTGIKVQLPKEKVWTVPFFLESPKSKDFKSPVLEIDFLIDSGAEPNIINIPHMD